MEAFKLTEKEAAILDRIAEATKMDCWFFIDEDLHVHDIEGDMPDATEADLVIMLEEGLGYGLDEPQSGGLSPEEIKIAEACFKRARLAAEAERIEKLKQDVLAGEDITGCVAEYLDIYEDTDVMHVDQLEKTAWELQQSKVVDEIIEGRRLEDLINDNPGATYFDYCEEKPIGRDWLIQRLGIKFFVVPVVYERYGTICVVADSAKDAYEKVKANPGDYPLPDEDFYVDDSFRVADDDEKNAIATIEELSDQWNDVPEAPAAPARHAGLTVKATVTFQRWEGDIARFNGEAEFDACDALDAMDDETVRRVSQGDPYALDAVYKGAVRLGQIHDYDGPFEVEIDEDDLEAYLEARGIE